MEELVVLLLVRLLLVVRIEFFVVFGPMHIEHEAEDQSEGISLLGQRTPIL